MYNFNKNLTFFLSVNKTLNLINIHRIKYKIKSKCKMKIRIKQLNDLRFNIVYYRKMKKLKWIELKVLLEYQKE